MQDGGMNPQDNQAPQNPPGWYPDGTGMQRWWDGTQWTENAAPMQPPVPASTSDPKMVATLVHVSALLVGFIGPLVGYLVYPNDPFIRDHSREALNFHLTLLIGFVVAFALTFVIIGIFLFPLLVLLGLIFEILAAVAANKGEYYRYPISIRFLTN